MPASGRGANLDTTRRITRVRKPAPRPTTSVSLRAPISKHPFSAAVKQASSNVSRARQTAPAVPTPHIPRIPNPTPTQTHAALALIHRSARAALGPHPTPQRVAEYQAQLHSDPRNREYVRSAAHYSAAAERHLQQEATALAGANAKRTLGALKSGPVTLGSLLGAAGDQEGALSQASRSAAIRRGEGDKPDSGGGLPTPFGTIKAAEPIIGALQAAAQLHIAPKGWGLPGKLLNEAVDLPAQTLLTGAIAGSATRSAVEGKPQALGAIGGSILDQVEHPIASAKAAPLATALMFAGGEGALGGIAGRVGRIGERLDEAGNVLKPGLVPSFTRARPDLELIGGEKIVGRKYNPDPLRKAAQRGYEKTLTKLPEGLGRQRSPLQAEGTRLKRNMVGGVVKPGRTDYIASGVEHGRKRFVRPIIHTVQQLKPKLGAEAVSLIKQGIVRRGTLVEDLEKRAEHLRSVQGDLSKRELGANKRELERVEGLLSHKEFIADPSEAFHVADTLRRLQEPLTAQLIHHGHLRPEQIRAALFPYAQAHMKAFYDGKALRAEDGSELANDAILTDMEQHGVKPSFVSHQSGITGGRSYYQEVLRTPSTARHARTGAAYHKGTADFSYDALTGSIADSASKAAKLELYAGLMNRLSHGRFDSAKAARIYKENFDVGEQGQRVHQGLGGYEPHDLGPEQVLGQDEIHPGDIKRVLDQFGLTEHAPAGESPVGKWTLLPRDVKRRLEQHNEAVHAHDDVRRLAQSYVQGFRHAKLLTSTRRIAGDIQEQALRMATEGVAPTFPKILGGDLPSHVVGRAGLAGKKIEKAMADLADSDGPLAKEFREYNGLMGSRGGLAVSSADQDIYRLADGFQELSGARNAYAAADAFKRGVPGKVVLAPWHAYRRFVEATLKTAEHKTYQAMLGKAGAEFFGGYRNILKAQDDAMKAMIAGRMDHNMADALVHRVDEFMGNWGHLTPRVKWAVQNLTPFGLWWLNSVRWLYRLPVTHPVKTGLAAALYSATRPQRNEQGQGFDSTNPVPGFLQGSIKAKIPVFGNVNLQPSYDSPFGAAIEPLATAADQIGPAVSGPYYAALNRSSLTHEPLQTADGKELGFPEQALNVIAQGISGPTLFASQIEQLAQKGGKPLGSANLLTDVASLFGGPSQTAPGTQTDLPQTLIKMAIPLRFTRDKRGGGDTELPPAPIPQGAPSGTGAQQPGGPSALQRAMKEAGKQSGARAKPSPLQAALKRSGR